MAPFCLFADGRDAQKKPLCRNRFDLGHARLSVHAGSGSPTRGGSVMMGRDSVASLCGDVLSSGIGV